MNKEKGNIPDLFFQTSTVIVNIVIYIGQLSGFMYLANTTYTFEMIFYLSLTRRQLLNITTL